jgi:hypothetical protein
MPLSRNIRDVTHLSLSLMQCIPRLHFQKLKHGIPFFSKVWHSVEKLSRHTDPLSDRVLKVLLDAGIISISSKKSAFDSSFFLVPKSDGARVNPIFYYSHLSKHLVSPHFHLLSLFLVIQENPWPHGLYYWKIYLSAAFLNITIKKPSKFAIAFSYGGIWFLSKKFLIGLYLAMFVLMTLSSS